jgi:PadR family transcriptional regulator PadR
MRGFVQPRLLLHLARKPAHGYELMEALGAADDPAPDPGTLYRTLRGLEEDGLVRSAWETGESGPARRVYELTEQGVEFLHAWAASIRGTRAQLDRFLAEYEKQFQGKTGG